MDSAGEKVPPYALASVDNALRLLLLLQEREEIRVSEAAAGLGVANSTAHRLLATLGHRGFVVQERSRVYRRGPALVTRRQTWGQRMPRTAHLHLARLSERTQETTHLVVLEGNGTRFLDCVESPQVLRVGSRTGMLLPAHTNSGGKALLARLPDAQLRALYPRGLPLGREGRPTDLDALRRILAATRRRGYGTNTGESERGVSAAGRHVCGPDGAVLGALVVAAPTARCPRPRLTQLAEQLLEAVHDLEADLAADP